MSDDATPRPGDASPERHTFPRSRRLKRRRLIRPLFQRGRNDVDTVAAGTLRVLYRVVPRGETGYDTPVQVGFAPGRRVRGVHRMRLRRLLREAYRVHQHDLVGLFLHRPAETLTLMLLYRSDPAQADEAVPRDVPRALRRLTERLREEQGEASGSPERRS